MKKSCPRCRQVFNCESNTYKHCFCADVVLDNSTRDFLKKTHYDCLCNACLKELNDKILKVKDKEFDPKIFNSPEGEYYYRDKGMVVLTELYHISKGSCCKSGCRHCAYGYQLIMN